MSVSPRAGLGKILPIALMAAGVAASPSLSSAAAAAPGPSQSGHQLVMGSGKGCPDGYFCLFEHDNKNSDYVALQVGAKKLRHFATHKRNGFNDRASYVWNRTQYRWCIFENENYKKAVAVYEPGQEDNLADEGGWWNDRASSARKCPAVR